MLPEADGTDDWTLLMRSLPARQCDCGPRRLWPFPVGQVDWTRMPLPMTQCNCDLKRMRPLYVGQVEWTKRPLLMRQCNCGLKRTRLLPVLG